MKRVLSLFLILCLVFALTGCMSDEERQSRKEALNALNGGETEYSLSTGTTLENQELFDGRNVIVQLAGITGTPEYPELKLAVRNGTRENLNFSVNSLVINGWEVDGWLDLYDVSPPHRHYGHHPVRQRPEPVRCHRHQLGRAVL